MAGMSRQIRFGSFEINLKEGELRNNGLPVKLAPQPFRILALLASRPGEIISREEIQHAVWGGETFVDFEVGLNQCIRQIRAALGDNAQRPQYIQTLSRRGYRFVAPAITDAETGPATAEPLLDAAAPGRGVAAATSDSGQTADSAPTAAVASVAHTRVRIARWGLAGLGAAVVFGFLIAGVYRSGWRAEHFSLSAFQGRQTKPIRSLAVLPFRNLSPDPGQEYFAEGMTDQLITDLAQIHDLRVISRTSVAPYAKTRKLLPVVAGELGVDAVVEGSVVRSASTIKITAQLVRARPERHIWAKSFERTSADAISLESEIAEEIAAEIQLKLTPQEKTELGPRRREPAEAEEAYLRGQYALQLGQSKWNKDAQLPLEQSIGYFERAIQVDPNYADSYAGIATAYDALLSLDARNTKLDPAAISAKIKAAALKAVQLDPRNARAHLALAWDRFVEDWNWSGANAEFTQAVSSNPGYAALHDSYAMFLCAMGRSSEAIGQVRTAEELDPASASTRLVGGWIYYHARQYGEAVRENQAAVTLAPDSPRAHDALGWTLVRQRQFQQAAAQFQAAARLSNDTQTLEAYMAYLDAAAGKRNGALAQLDRIGSRRNPVHISPYVIAEIYAALGESDLAFTHLEQAFNQRSFEMVYLRLDPDLDSVRSDPRFTVLERRMKLPN